MAVVALNKHWWSAGETRIDSAPALGSEIVEQTAAGLGSIVRLAL